MSVWTLPTVAQEPVARIRRWRVFRFSLNDRYLDVLFGWDPVQDCGRCSTVIKEFDAGGLRARTSSGRVYKLAGAPGFDDDALYVFHQMYGVNVPVGLERDEVSGEYWRQMRAEVWRSFQETAPELAAELSELALPENQLVDWLCEATETGETPVDLMQAGRGQEVRELARLLPLGFLS